jgi:hypothetical protein
MKDPDATAVIIAHSHGGNVALRALQHLESTAGRIRVVTLATPFLRVFARSSLQLPFLIKLFMFGAISLILFIILFLGVLAGLDLLLPLSPGLPIIFVLAGVLAGVLAFGAGFFIMAWLNEVFTNPHAALAIEELAHYDTKGAAASRMLVIRAVDDEASLTLAAGSIGSRLSFLTLVVVIPTIYTVGLVPLLLGSFFGLSAETRGGLLLGLYFGTLILFFVPGAFKSFFFGREFLLNAMTCDIAVDSVPDTLGQVEAITLRPVEAAMSKPRSLKRPFSLRWMSEILWLEFREINRQWVESSQRYRQWLESRETYFQFVLAQTRGKAPWQLRHEIHNHPNCADEIVRWLRRVT